MSAERKSYSLRYNRTETVNVTMSVNIAPEDVEKVKAMNDDERDTWLKAQYSAKIERKDYGPLYDIECEGEEVIGLQEGPHNFSLVEWINGAAQSETALA